MKCKQFIWKMQKRLSRSLSSTEWFMEMPRRSSRGGRNSMLLHNDVWSPVKVKTRNVQEEYEGRRKTETGRVWKKVTFSLEDPPCHLLLPGLQYFSTLHLYMHMHILRTHTWRYLFLFSPPLVLPCSSRGGMASSFFVFIMNITGITTRGKHM